MIEQIIASLITTLLGVIVGFFLSQRGTTIRDRETRKQQAESARILVIEEIDFNLELLGSFWEQLNKRDSDRDLPTYGEAMARKLAFISLPILSHKLWENQIAVLTVAMTKEQINQPLHFHQKIDSLVTLRARLVELVKQSPPEYPDLVFARKSAYRQTEFYRESPQNHDVECPSKGTDSPAIPLSHLDGLFANACAKKFVNAQNFGRKTHY